MADSGLIAEVKSGDLEAVTALIERGSEVNQLDEQG